MGSIPIYTQTASGYVDFDVTSYLQTAKQSGNTVTIALNANCAGWQDVFSRKNATNQPQLIVSSH
ncbi:CBM96 family carbohydrate-binding protein [Dictyobacter kobayashii]|uniref:Carbohydrate-binding module family 96 domain-containing protein n=1 Tax=Dictyobacter kobayashii TaxID=2014872 RepID=A0A402AIY2_9CHLR|nr:hypothetical protein [Dictyobacter kobayashii]GCE19056.1 hypothetical protein KDK_28560 [Dictyobacter kobayashii]